MAVTTAVDQSVNNEPMEVEPVQGTQDEALLLLFPDISQLLRKFWKNMLPPLKREGTGTLLGWYLTLPHSSHLTIN